MGVFFVSDSHHGHLNIIKYCNRPFSSVREMDVALIENWNKTVKPDDEVYHLGDVSFYKDQTMTADIISNLNGRKYLILGNHDKHLKPFVLDLFERVFNLHEIYVSDPTAHKGRQMIILCHYPLRTWNKSHHGSWHLHGHCHGSLPPDPNSYILDVGVDCHNFTPISYEQVKQVMAGKQFKPIDHHKEM